MKTNTSSRAVVLRSALQTRLAKASGERNPEGVVTVVRLHGFGVLLDRKV